MTGRFRPASVPIPDRMAALPKDARGYPIPATVLIDQTGRPQFSINNTKTLIRLVREDCCHICGTKLYPARWFVGGPASALHKNGAYRDGPLHRDCLHYALQVCPYLAAPSYARRIDDRLLPDGEPVRLLVDTSQRDDRPALFVAAMTHGAKTRFDSAGPLYLPQRPWRNFEYWRHGTRLDAGEGRALAEAACRDFAARPAPDPRFWFSTS